MITPIGETQKRLEIASYILEQIKPHIECMYLGGSMGYGQNFSVAPWCDIDTIVIIKKENLQGICSTPYFNQLVSENVKELFMREEIDFFWASKNCNGIQVDILAYNKDSYETFLMLKKGLRRFVQKRPSDYVYSYGFSGEIFKTNREIKETEGGFIYNNPCLHEGKYRGNVPKDDIFFMNHLMYEKDNFFSLLEQKFWEVACKKLLEEKGPNLDLNKFNILNTLYTYQTNKQGMPPELIEKISKKTKDILGQINNFD